MTRRLSSCYHHFSFSSRPSITSPSMSLRLTVCKPPTSLSFYLSCNDWNMNETINVSLFRLKQLKNIKRGKCLTILLPPFSYSHWKIWEASDFLFLPILAEAKKFWGIDCLSLRLLCTLTEKVNSFKKIKTMLIIHSGKCYPETNICLWYISSTLVVSLTTAWPFLRCTMSCTCTKYHCVMCLY